VALFADKGSASHHANISRQLRSGVKNHEAGNALGSDVRAFGFGFRSKR
jgi:hypothetical protein